MTVLIDTNVILDVLLKRNPFYLDSAEVLRLSEKGSIKGYLTSNSIADIAYILRKNVGKERTKDIISDLMGITDIVSVTKGDIKKSLNLAKVNDIEDGIQVVCAKKIKADYIITRDEEGFKYSNISAITPGEFLSKIKNIL